MTRVARPVLAFLVLSCLGSELQAADNGTLRVQLKWVDQAQFAGFYVAEKKGFFRDEGLDVSYIAFDSAAKMIAPFASGDLDVGAGGPSAGLYNAVARGIDIRIVADKSSTPPGRPINFLLVRKDHVDSGRYKTLADLKGMKIANARRTQ